MILVGKGQEKHAKQVDPGPPDQAMGRSVGVVDFRGQLIGSPMTVPDRSCLGHIPFKSELVNMKNWLGGSWLAAMMS